ncbi:MAG: precorrin-8X methylmutase [Lachnospiraceae bacterium]|nr:precorrin-8X methylmutase [Lachnospiraceae bacterium]
MNLEHIKPEDIEKRSFEIITDELRERGFQRDVSNEQLTVIKRCIHTTADFDYAETLCFSEGAVSTFQKLIREGATVVTDTNMALSGINKQVLAQYGCDSVCFMADEDVAVSARQKGVTRASVSMNRAMSISGPVIFVIGNAPTALITIRECYDTGTYIPAFVVGVPVGFVNVVAAKELITQSDIPYIVNRGRKGGSNVAAAIVNALLYDMRKTDQNRS